MEMKCTICKEIVESYTITEYETLCDDCYYDLQKEIESESLSYNYTKFDAEYDHWKERRHEHD